MLGCLILIRVSQTCTPFLNYTFFFGMKYRAPLYLFFVHLSLGGLHLLISLSGNSVLALNSKGLASHFSAPLVLREFLDQRPASARFRKHSRDYALPCSRLLLYCFNAVSPKPLLLPRSIRPSQGFTPSFIYNGGTPFIDSQTALSDVLLFNTNGLYFSIAGPLFFILHPISSIFIRFTPLSFPPFSFNQPLYSGFFKCPKTP